MLCRPMSKYMRMCIRINSAIAFSNMNHLQPKFQKEFNTLKVSVTLKNPQSKNTEELN